MVSITDQKKPWPFQQLAGATCYFRIIHCHSRFSLCFSDRCLVCFRWASCDWCKERCFRLPLTLALNSGEMWDEIQITQINTSIRWHLQINARHWSAAETAQAKQDSSQLFRGLWNSVLQSVPWKLWSILSNTFWGTRRSLKVICENGTC